MPACPSCSQDNLNDSNFCSQCGQALVKDSSAPEAEPSPSQSVPTTLQLWETFIGPRKSLQFSLNTGWRWRPAFWYYREKFENLETPAGPRFALSWHWPAALFDSFLWFLYRKMYMWALLYAFMPAVAIFLTGDMMVGIVSRVLAGGSANYLYYWHIKDKIQRIMSAPNVETPARAKLIHEEGGVQPYVLWLGAALHLFMLGLLLAAIGEGPPEMDSLGGPGEGKSPKFFEERSQPL